MKLLIGLLVAFVIGAACRLFDIPAPAPPMWQGALLVVSMTLGYSLAGAWVSKPAEPPAPVPAVTRGGVPGEGEAGPRAAGGESTANGR